MLMFPATSLQEKVQLKNRKHRQSYQHADSRRQRPQAAQRRMGMRNMGHGHYQPCDHDGFCNHVILTFDLLTSSSKHAERML